MVTDRGLFLIDSSSLFEETHKTFMGTPLILKGGKDNTFLYGFLKYLLTLRRELGIRTAIVLISRGCWAVASEQEVKEAAQLIEEMGIPVIDAKNSSIVDICHKYAPTTGAIYSENEALLQFARKDLCIVRSNDTNGYDYLFSDTVLQKYGVAPDRIPTFLALTSGPKDSVITRNQAVRLIDVFGNLEEILAGRSSFPNPGLRANLTESEGIIFARYQILRPSERENDQLISKSGGFPQLLNTEKNVQLLHSLGLHSLTRLLALPSKENQIIRTKSEGSSYEIMDNERALKALRRRLANAEEVAIDTESSSRDPRSATLFGIALSFDDGWSCYVPLLDHDLKGISPQKVVSVIKTQLENSGKKFIGHNIKYDYLLLRRNGIHLKSIYFDTMLAAFECYGDLEFLNLGFLSGKFLGKGKPSYKEMLGKKDSPWDIPVTKLAQHACKDAETSFQLYRFLENEMRSKRLMKQYVDLTMPLCKTLGDLEYSGVKVYKDKLYRFRNGLVGKANELRQSINTAVGRDINIESDEEVKNYLLSVHGIPEWMNLNKPFTTFLEYLGAIRIFPV
jgi:DNA polymerase-1